jgi:hypothetical protein
MTKTEFFDKLRAELAPDYLEIEERPGGWLVITNEKKSVAVTITDQARAELPETDWFTETVLDEVLRLLKGKERNLVDKLLDAAMAISDLKSGSEEWKQQRRELAGKFREALASG